MLINGIPATTLLANDRAISFGDGLFTTFRIVQQQVQHLHAHLARLQQGCSRLAIQGIDWPVLEQEMRVCAAQSTTLFAVGKVILSRGQGGRGYSSEQVINPSRIVSRFEFPPHIKEWRAQGVRLVHGQLQLAIQPALAGLKTLNRLEQVLAKQELVSQGALEGVFCDSQGYVVECNAANLFWRKGTQVFTPDLSLCGVDGIMRQKIMAFCEQHHSPIQVVRAMPAQLDDAEELFFCNSITGPVPVTQFEQHRFESVFFCKRLQNEFDPLPEEAH